MEGGFSCGAVISGSMIANVKIPNKRAAESGGLLAAMMKVAIDLFLSNIQFTKNKSTTVKSLRRTCLAGGVRLCSTWPIETIHT